MKKPHFQLDVYCSLRRSNIKDLQSFIFPSAIIVPVCHFFTINRFAYRHLIQNMLLNIRNTGQNVTGEWIENEFDIQNSYPKLQLEEIGCRVRILSN